MKQRTFQKTITSRTGESIMYQQDGDMASVSVTSQGIVMHEYSCMPVSGPIKNILYKNKNVNQDEFDAVYTWSLQH